MAVETPEQEAPKRVPRRYEFGPLEKRGLLFGFDTPQMVTAGAAVALAIVSLIVRPGLPGLVGAVLMLLAAAGVLWIPWRHRPVVSWVPVVVGAAGDKLLGRTAWRSRAPQAGFVVDQAGKVAAVPAQPVALPPPLARVRLLETPWPEGGMLGVLADNERLVGIIEARGTNFTLADSATQESLLRGWAQVVDSFADASAPVVSLQVIERTGADDAGAVDAYFRAHRDPELPADHPIVAAYSGLVGNAAPASQRHEVLLAVALDARRARRAIKQRGGGDIGGCAVLAQEVAAVKRQLVQAGLVASGVLNARGVAQALRVAFEPAARKDINAAVAQGAPGGTATHRAWPLSTETAWGWYRSGETFHTTFWIAEWPRIGVGPDFLGPLLLAHGTTRTVSVTFEPVDALAATRAAEMAGSTDAADAMLREKYGFRTSVRKQRQRANATRREHDLASGFAQVRMSGYVTVSAPSLEALDNACAQVTQAARRCRLVLEPLSGEQDRAFTYTLPLTRGVR